MNIKTCLECGSKFDTLAPKFCSRKCFHTNYGRNHRKENSPRWKGDATGYHGVHHWLRKNFGSNGQCEYCKNEGRLQWAKIIDKEYERKRENFLHLCSSCHKKYDMTDEVRKNMSEAHKGKPSGRRGKPVSLETRTKISSGLKNYFAFHTVDK